MLWGSQGARTISFVEDVDHQRFKQVTPEDATLYIAALGGLAEVSNPSAPAERWSDYLSIGNAKVGVRVVQTTSETPTMRYFHADHLGSISVVTSENGVTSRLILSKKAIIAYRDFRIPKAKSSHKIIFSI